MKDIQSIRQYGLTSCKAAKLIKKKLTKSVVTFCCSNGQLGQSSDESPFFIGFADVNPLSNQLNNIHCNTLRSQDRAKWLFFTVSCTTLVVILLLYGYLHLFIYISIILSIISREFEITSYFFLSKSEVHASVRRFLARLVTYIGLC